MTRDREVTLRFETKDEAERFRVEVGKRDGVWTYMDEYGVQIVSTGGCKCREPVIKVVQGAKTGPLPAETAETASGDIIYWHGWHVPPIWRKGL